MVTITVIIITTGEYDGCWTREVSTNQCSSVFILCVSVVPPFILTCCFLINTIKRVRHLILLVRITKHVVGILYLFSLPAANARITGLKIKTSIL